MRLRILLWSVIVLLFIVAPTAARWYTNWLWFGEVGYLRVFWVPFLSRLAVTAVVSGALWLLAFVNLRRVVRAGRLEVIEMSGRAGRFRPLRRTWWNALGWGGWVAAALAFMVGLNASQEWVAFQQFVHATPFGQTDPLFGRDVAFYVFRLPVYRMIADGLFIWLLLITAAVVAGYGAIYGRMLMRGISLVPSAVRGHVSLLIGAVVLIRGWGLWLDAFDLLYSTRGVAFGASFTDVHAVLPALRILTVLFAVFGLIVLANAWFRTVRLAVVPVVLIVVAWVLGLVMYPGLVQTFRVKPNELT
ncbi:MAG: UPF0182 family protein, partial [Armatimonadota bacterium]